MPRKTSSFQGKSAHERGFGYGTVYKSETIDLRDLKGKSSSSVPTLHFGFAPNSRPTEAQRAILDQDGLPYVGQKVLAGEPICAYWDEVSGKTMFKKFKGDEYAYVDTVRLLGADAEAATVDVCNIYMLRLLNMLSHS